MAYDIIGGATADSVGKLSFWQQLTGSIWNAATGTLTQAQKQALIDSQAAGVVAAGGDSSAAATQAQGDVTAVLTANGADPSQASLFNNPGLSSLVQKAGWVLAFAALYFVYRIFTVGRRG